MNGLKAIGCALALAGSGEMVAKAMGKDRDGSCRQTTE